MYILQVNGTNPVPDESFLHVFLDCSTVRNGHNKFRDYLPDGYQRDEQERFFFLFRDADSYFIIMTVLIS
jgi:hypothetical protein